jgi:1-acyl-sn-glycerol-3-phosphate acyltransferase
VIAESVIAESVIEEGTQERWDPRAGSLVRGVVCFLPMVVSTFGLAAVMVALGTVVPRFFRRHRRSLVRCWGRIGLFISGIRLEDTGTEHLEGPGGRIVLFNHQSLLDLFILAAFWSEHSVVVYKQEFHRVPIIGQLMKELDLIPVDRSNRQSAVLSMTAAGQRVRMRGETLLVAPEGTRSHEPGLLDFKRGPFHVATETGLPLVVFVVRGVRSLLPAGRVVVRSGTLRVDVLPPISTKNWTEADITKHMAEVREIFLRYLPDAGKSSVHPTRRTEPHATGRPGEIVTAGRE